LLAGLVGAVSAAGVGAIALRLANRLYQGLMMLVVVILAGIVITAEPNFLNGGAGVAAVPPPLQASLHLSLVHWGWFYVGVTGLITLVAFIVVRKLTESPWGRRLRAIRENPLASEALGIRVYRESLIAFAVGGAVAAVSGAVLVGFIGAWAPGGWTYGETLLYLTSIIVGGMGNMYGVALGVAIIWTAIQEGVRYLPTVSSSTASDALEYIVIGVVTLLFLRLRPQGVLPERKRRFKAPRQGGATPENRREAGVQLALDADRGLSE
jgi:ABC-type branched-subunit amino acid transport system permease subunit